MDLEKINLELQEKTPHEIIRWALSLGKRVFATTSFGRNAAVMLKLITDVDPDTPIVWVDSGYNVRDTYLVAEQLMQMLPINMRIYTPIMTAERRNALLGGVPGIDDPELHKEFTQQVKLEPFQRAIDEINPDIWLTGIRQNETEHRKSLNVVSKDNRGLLKVAPIFQWDEDDVQAYMDEHQLPSCKRYFDPTKVHENRECGMHTSA